MPNQKELTTQAASREQLEGTPHAAKWYIIDAKDQVVGRVATVLATLVSGKHKTIYTPHVDTGDFVVVLNADKVVLTRNKWKGKKYYNHSGYIGGLKEFTAEELLKRKPTEILRRAVWGMLSKSALSRHQIKKLKLYASDQHPHAAQNPQQIPAGVLRRSSLGRGA